MTRRKPNVPRPFVEDGEGPLGVTRPFAPDKVEKLEVELEDAINQSGKSEMTMHRIIMQLEEMGLRDEAKAVQNMREHEMEHGKKLKNILDKLRRSTS